MKYLTILPNRSVISIAGDDRKTFLQGLITNDINKVTDLDAIYAFYLSPQGRFLYDFFIIADGEKLLLDVAKEFLDEIVKKLSFYKLRSKVEIKKEPDLAVFASNDKNSFENEKIVFVDPRMEKMGYRAICNSSFSQSKNIDEYNLQRLTLRLPDDSDFTYDKSFPLEFGFDNFNAVDYKKGCYIGQETTARMHYKSVIRKKIFLCELTQASVNKGEKIIFEEKEVGEILSSVFYHNKLFALALIKNLDNDGIDVNLSSQKLIVNNQEIKLI